MYHAVTAKEVVISPKHAMVSLDFALWTRCSPKIPLADQALVCVIIQKFAMEHQLNAHLTSSLTIPKFAVPRLVVVVSLYSVIPLSYSHHPNLLLQPKILRRLALGRLHCALQILLLAQGSAVESAQAFVTLMRFAMARAHSALLMPSRHPISSAVLALEVVTLLNSALEIPRSALPVSLHITYFRSLVLICNITDAHQPAKFVCHASKGDCDPAEVCDGETTLCPVDVKSTKGTVCRAASNGGCDVAETCDGTSVSCPANGFADGSVVCRVANGSCDVPEVCTGHDEKYVRLSSLLSSISD